MANPDAILVSGDLDPDMTGTYYKESETAYRKTVGVDFPCVFFATNKWELVESVIFTNWWISSGSDLEGDYEPGGLPDGPPSSATGTATITAVEEEEETTTVEQGGAPLSVIQERRRIQSLPVLQKSKQTKTDSFDGYRKKV